MKEEIYIQQGGEESGPYSSREIEELLDTGEISSEAEYWHHGMTAWSSVDEFDFRRLANIRKRRAVPRGAEGRQSQIVVGAVLAVVALVITAGVFTRNPTTTAGNNGTAADGIPPARIAEVLMAMHQDGFPTNLTQLDDWYERPPDDENGALIYENDLKSVPSYNPKRGDNLTTYVRQNADRIPRLLAASRIEKWRFPIDIKAGLETLMPHLPNFKNGVRLLMGAAVREAKLRKSDRSVELLNAGLRLPNILDDEPFLISSVVKFTSYHIAWTGVEDVLGRLALKDADLLSLRSSLIKAESHNTVVRSLAGEKLIFIDLYLAGEPRQRKLLKSYQEFRPEFKTVPENFRTLPEYRSEFEQAILTFDDSIEAARSGNYQRMLLCDAQTADRFENPKTLGWFLPLKGFFEKVVRWEAQRRVALAVIAMERHRAANRNELPDNLESLVPEYLDSVPIDPFDGNGVRYIRRARGYVVYSIGSDRVDDQGQPLESAKDQLGDLAMTVNRR